MLFRFGMGSIPFDFRQSSLREPREPCVETRLDISGHACACSDSSRSIVSSWGIAHPAGPPPWLSSSGVLGLSPATLPSLRCLLIPASIVFNLLRRAASVAAYTPSVRFLARKARFAFADSDPAVPCLFYHFYQQTLPYLSSLRL